MLQQSTYHLLARIQELEIRLEESEQMIDAIKQGEVDAFAISNQQQSEIYTLQSGDYAYRVLIEQFGEGALNVSEEGLIVYTNPYFCTLLNLGYEKVIGTSLFDFIHPESLKNFKKLFIASTTGKSRGEINLLANGLTIPVYISLTSLQPKLPTVGIIITDFTVKKKNESTILDYQKNLENKNKELIQSNSELASFAYIASHDLQEPLRKIQTFANHIIQKEAPNLSDVGRNHFGRIQMAAKRMQALIEDLLVYSRTNSVERRFVYTGFNTLVDEVLDDMKEELAQKGATVHVGELCHAWLIPFQFRQLIQNLLKFIEIYRPGNKTNYFY